MSDECMRRIPNKIELVFSMSVETLLAYAKIHISTDSQELIDRLVMELELRTKEEKVNEQHS